MPEIRLVAKLKATSSITALTSTRIYPGIRPGGTDLPAIVWAVASDVPSNHARGTTGTAMMRISLSCMAATYAVTRALGDAVAAAISGWVDESGCIWHLDNRSDDVGEPITGQDVPEYFCDSQDYTVWY